MADFSRLLRFNKIGLCPSVIFVRFVLSVYKKMALKTAKFSEIPEGEKPITKSAAVEFQLDIMETLCPENRRIFINYGYLITSFTTAATSIYLHGHYRKALNVLTHGRIFSFVPGVLFPSILNLGLHRLLITENILVQKWACPVCYHIRSALINLTCGTIYPAIAAPIIAISYARKIKLDVPPVNSKRVLKFVYEKTKPVMRHMGIFACVQLLVGATIAEMEARENNHFNKNINRYIREYQERSARENAI